MKYSRLYLWEFMKKLLTIFISLFISILFCNSCKSSNDLERKINDVVSNYYNEDESLSFQNYLSYSFNAPVVFQNDAYEFEYQDHKIIVSKEKNVLIENIKKDEDIIYFDNIEKLKKQDLSVGFIAETKEYYAGSNKGGARYKIINDNKPLSIPLDNGLFAEIIPQYRAFSIESLGVKGDGKDDDSDIINYIFQNIGQYDVSYLIFESKEYLCCHNINLYQNENLSLLGNDSYLVINDQYDDEVYHEFFFSVTSCEKLLFSNINITYNFSETMNGIKTQLGIFNSQNIEFYHCQYVIPETVLKSLAKDREFTNFDCYTNWENILINNCQFENVCDAEAGGSLWIRDFHNLGSKDIKVLNSSFHKIAHDELIAVFMGSIENVLIKNNKFKVEDEGVSSSVMNFSFGSFASSQKANNIVFENNEIDCCSTGGLIWVRKATGVKIRKNKIKAHISSKTTDSFRLIEASSNGEETNKIDLIEENEIIFDSNKKNLDKQIHIIKNADIVQNNVITTNFRITDLFLNCNVLNRNVCNINSDSEFIVYNVLKECKNNVFNLNVKIGTVFRYYGCGFSQSINIKNNIIKYNYKENEEDISYIIMLNDMNMNDNIIYFENNIVETDAIGKKSRFLFLAPSDEIQTFYFRNNIVGNYKTPANDYLKNVEVIRS